MDDYSPFSDLYLIALAATAGLVTLLAIFTRNGSLGLAAAVLVVYLLHLGSLRSVERDHRERRGTLRQVERMVEDVRGLDAFRARVRHAGGGAGAPGSVGNPGSDGASSAARPDPDEEVSGEEADGEPRVHRQFAFGTVALIEDLLTPEEVSHVLLEQERRPNRRFGEIALRYGFLTQDQIQELLAIQREGLFSPEAIRSARQRVEAYRKNQVADLSGGFAT